MIYMRGQAARLRPVAQLGNRAWGWDDVLPYFKRCEDYVHGPDEMHGAGGEWRVGEMRLHWEILEAFRDAAAEVGIPRTTTSTGATTRAAAISRSTRSAACAGARPRRS